jgi:predicted RNA-binding Zn ribbon-like protein
MAIGWLTVLQSVPWTEVVRNAPKVAAGAKKLWGSVANKDGVDHSADLEAQSRQPPEHLAQITTLQSVAGELQQRLTESTGLITALAEQNAQLIQRIEAMRKRTARFGAALVLVGIASGAALWLSLRLT